MKTLLNASTRLFPLALGALLSACVANSNDEASSGTSTHFLDECEDSAECDEGLSCICGKCTQTCDAEEQCRAWADDATCVDTSQLGQCQGPSQKLCHRGEEEPPAPVTSEPKPDEAGTPEPTTSEPQPAEAGSPEPTTSEPALVEAGSPEPTTSEPALVEAGSPEPTTSEPQLVEAGPSASSEAGPPAELRCATVSEAPSAMCASELCYPETLDVVAYEADADVGFACSAYVGVEACGGAPDYQAFEYRGDDLFIYISFDPSVGDEYTTESFAAGFEYMWLEIYVPNAEGLEFSKQVDSIEKGDPRIKELVYADGRLKGRLELGDLGTVRQHIESTEDGCVVDDIAGECYCSYEIESLPTTVQFDLPVEGS